MADGLIGRPVPLYAAYMGVFDGGSLLAGLRTPGIFKSGNFTAAGNTALWTPAAGKSFRLMRYRISVPGNAAFATTAGTVTVTFQDATTALAVALEVLQIPLAAGAVSGEFFNGPWVDLGNGILSAAAGNALNVNLVLGGTGALTGGVNIVACGTEE